MVKIRTRWPPRERSVLDFKVELFPKTMKVSKYLCDRQGRNVFRR